MGVECMIINVQVQLNVKIFEVDFPKWEANLKETLKIIYREIIPMMATCHNGYVHKWVKLSKCMHILAQRSPKGHVHI